MSDIQAERDFGILRSSTSIVADRRAADTLIESSWNLLGQRSGRVAVSGEGGEKCIFREIIK